MSKQIISDSYIESLNLKCNILIQTKRRINLFDEMLLKI